MIIVFIASAVASSLDGTSTSVLPRYLRLNFDSCSSSSGNGPKLLELRPIDSPISMHSRLLARAHSSQSSEKT